MIQKVDMSTIFMKITNMNVKNSISPYCLIQKM